HVIVRKKPGVTIVPSAKLRVPGLDVAEVRLRQLHRYIVIVEVPERVTIDREQSIFVERPFEVQILDATVRLIAWQPVLLLELRTITTRYYAADAELDPILVFFGLLFRGGSSDRFAIRSGANPSSGKGSRKNQHKESARGGLHNIEINI